MPQLPTSPIPPSPTLIRYLHKQSKNFPSSSGVFFTRNPSPSLSFWDRCPRDAAWGLSVLRSPPKPKRAASRHAIALAGQGGRYVSTGSSSGAARRLSTTAARSASVVTSDGLGALPFDPVCTKQGQVRHWTSSAVALAPQQQHGQHHHQYDRRGDNRAQKEEGNTAWLRSLLSRRAWKKGMGQGGGGFGEDGSGGHEGGAMFNLLQSRIGGKAGGGNELRLRCTEFDEHGKVTLVNGEFKKSELIAKYGLLPRDLRKIDSSLLPNMLVRPSAILINLLHLRVLIKHNRVLVFDAYGSTDSYTQSLFMYDLEGKLAQHESASSKLPYELRALEAVLISVCSALESEFDGVREPVVRVLRELEEDIDRDKLRYLLVYSKKLGTFSQKAKLVRNAIDELLDADDDLAAMYLTEKAAGRKRGESEHTEVEMLLESYHKVCDEIVQVSGNLVSNIRNTEEIVKAILDANRNALMLLDLKFSIGTLGIGSGAFVAALYGMNLKNFFEESGLGFGAVTGSSALLAAMVVMLGLSKLRRVQRVSMWGGREVRDAHRGGEYGLLREEGRRRQQMLLQQREQAREQKRERVSSPVMAAPSLPPSSSPPPPVIGQKEVVLP